MIEKSIAHERIRENEGFHSGRRFNSIALCEDMAGLEGQCCVVVIVVGCICDARGELEWRADGKEGTEKWIVAEGGLGGFECG